MVVFLEFITKLVNLFPKSPFTDFITALNESVVDTLGYLNYFIPINTMASITSAWVVAIMAAKVASFVFNALKRKL